MLPFLQSGRAAFSYSATAATVTSAAAAASAASAAATVVVLIIQCGVDNVLPGGSIFYFDAHFAGKVFVPVVTDFVIVSARIVVVPGGVKVVYGVVAHVGVRVLGAGCRAVSGTL
ncbi:MAG: hypothetical protein VR68_05835 [Peptococcaceae bacterium BRH_c4a]|nr:MAG: hypothetical protein VR68_05835 [Peptococcaceae bacterium BRH_c4a]